VARRKVANVRYCSNTSRHRHWKKRRVNWLVNFTPVHLSHRVVSKWNMLDNDSVMAKTVNGFKTKLERERAKKMGLFLD